MLLHVSNTLRRIATDPIATADVWGPIVVPLFALLALLAAQQYVGRWPDLWRFRRAVLPIVDRLADGEYDDELDVVDEHVGVDLEAAADQLPEKTGMPLQASEFVGVLDAPPAVVREELRSMPRVWPNTLASIQFEAVDGSRVWEVGSYAYRPEGFLGEWQYHVRLTPADGGQKTRLWAHYELSALRYPVRHYDGEGWSSEEGVHEIVALFASDNRFDPSDRAVALIGDVVEA
ncbi:hypothetical protein C461_03173 [Halorubrum aidingense JCM 13560]|uniref:Uncharacterized protein n=1 Tax=Halorubrum aidingense JCM 13560 TaxID=1230454 RepID=M0PI84_9EURY|nr:hypothetical protein [Halorubrum aidingense]EMA69329.1 hypothetical protein C461_03173 [Halorubrum aidingense JCM 13560]